MPLRRTVAPPGVSAGFALVEVLVAAALLAIGLLGQLGLLLHALRLERDAANVATAATLAADLADRIRANAPGALSYAFDPAAAPAVPANCRLGAPADATARAACDLEEWLDEIGMTLPGASAQVDTMVVAGTAAIDCAIAIRWSTQDNVAGQYVLRVRVP